jgi:hypothetical protein
VTKVITREVHHWALDHGFVCNLETYTVAFSPAKEAPQSVGVLDLAGIHPTGLRLAIEIDRSDKSRSLAKLAGEANRGAIAIWVRWSGTCRLAVPDNVGLIQLHGRTLRFEGIRGKVHTRGRRSELPPPLRGSPVRTSRLRQATLFDLP